MKLLLLLTIIASSIATSAHAQVELLAIRLCGKIQDDAARLKCFDAIGKTVDGAKSDASTNGLPPAKAEWQIKESNSPIDDTAQYSAGLMSEDGKSFIVLRCIEHKTDVVLSPNRLFVSGRGSVIMRINDLPPVTSSWIGSSDNRSVFAPNGIALIKLLPENGKIFFRTTGWRERADDASFNLGAVSAIRDHIKDVCKWREDQAK